MEFKAKDRRLEGDTILRQTQLAELYLLDIFVEICEKHNLQYFLDSGTLLGAVRRGGFIPWDDDIDVGMPVDDFKKFLKIAEKELPDNLLIKKPSFFFGKPEGMAKLMDRCSFFCETYSRAQDPCGFFIDIFPFDRFPAINNNYFIWLTQFCAAAWASQEVYLQRYTRNSFKLLNNCFHAVVWQCIGRIIQCVTRIVAIFVSCNYRYCVGIGRVRQIGVPVNVLFPLSKSKFEGKEYSVPNKVDLFLRNYYGDWHVLPPPENRIFHASIICPTQAPDAPWARKYVPPKV